MSKRTKRRPKFYKRKSYLIAFSLTALLIIVVYAGLSTMQSSLDQEKTPKAAIIDQLSSSYPNNTFWSTANSMFHDCGWRMHYYVGSSFSGNVSFYRSLPTLAFKLIIIRAHTAMSSTGALALFTSEKWDDGKATTDYLNDFDYLYPENNRLAKVRVTETSQAYFGITPSFVKAMQGDFQGALIIMMGCDGMANTKMAEAFIQEGAEAYIGWTGLVSSDHTDAATQQLLKHLMTEKKAIATAITETLAEVGDDPTYGSTISYYPLQAGEYRFSV